MNLYTPLSVPGSTPDYESALPEATFELCGEKGIYVAVGNSVQSLVYRGTWEHANPERGKLVGKGSWHWCYSKEEND